MSLSTGVVALSLLVVAGHVGVHRVYFNAACWRWIFVRCCSRGR